MNQDQQRTLEILIFVAVIIVFTANKSSDFWRTLFKPVPLQINGPVLPNLFNGINITLPGGTAGGAVGGAVGGAIGSGL